MTPGSGASWLELEISRQISQINREVTSRADRGLNEMRSAAIEVLSRDGTGRRYGRHVASSPGEAPAPDKGNLRKNWRQLKLLQGNGRGIRVRLRLKSSMPYSEYLEKGTRKMASRPYRERIKSKARPRVARIFAGV